MNPGALAVVGPGRAGSTLARGLVARGWTLTAVAGRDSARTAEAARRLDTRAVAVSEVGRGADLVVLATPDEALREVAAAVADGLEPGALVIHLSGASDLGVLAPIATERPDVRLGSLHPLQTIPEGADPARLEGAWCAVEGPVVELALDLGMHPFVVPAQRRADYHAAASIASNHLVALLGQVQRVAESAGVPFEAFLGLVDASVDGVRALGPRGALTGPVARGDVATVAAHLDALDESERETYRAMARAASRLVGRMDPELAAVLDDETAGTDRAVTS